MADESPTVNSRRHRRNQSTPLNSIPLQDLGPSQHAPISPDPPSPSAQASHRRTLSDRGRSLFRRNRDSLLSHSPAGNPPPPNTRAYSPISEDPPSPPQIDRKLSPLAYVTSPTGHRTRVDDGQDEDERTPLSPHEGSSFQQAMGFAGISLGAPARPSLHSAHGRMGSVPSLRTVDTSPYDEEPDDPTGFFPHEEDMDTVPLTDMNRRLEAHSPQRNDRGSFQSIRFLSPSVSHSNNPDVESGNLTPSGRWSRSPDGHSRSPANSRRSLSPMGDSPFHRAGDMMRKMSMRVVNISNEPEVAERMIRRKSSVGRSPRIPESGFSGDGAPHSPVSEKMPSPMLRPPNPFRGKSLGIFPPDSKLRLKLADLLLHPMTEPFILVLIVFQTTLLAVEARNNVNDEPRSKRFGTTWIDIALLVLFIIYTIEIMIRVIVSGFVVNPIEYSTIDRKVGLRTAVMRKANDMFALHRKPSVRNLNPLPPLTPGPQPGILRSLTTNTMMEVPGGSKQAQLQRLAFRAFLRHSFNRLDFLAVCSFWISFIIGIFGVESQKHVFVFRMLSCLRIVRLLGITSGTLVILRSLKKAAPTLLNVAFLTGFFWLLFAIIGVQSFKSSLRRTCVWTNPNDASETFTNAFQFCGGYLLPNGTARPWIHADGSPGADDAKGFYCPINSVCIEGDNPYNGTVSYDNIFQSLEMVFVVMSSNTFSDQLYYLADSDYLSAGIFFAAGIIIFPLWLVNLLIAVITSSFQVIRDESKASAFTAQEQVKHLDTEEGSDGFKQKTSTLKHFVGNTRWIWIAVITYGLIVQCLRSAYMSPSRDAFLNSSEIGVTIALDIEIILRFIADWRKFHKSKRNLVDLALAVITTVIQIPVIKHSGQPYAWLTFFQIIRIYRVVLAVEMTRTLILTVLGDFSGFANLIMFVMLLCFLAAIFATQIFRGQIPQENDEGEAIRVPFFDIYNAFLGMYQIFSSENWTDIMYDVTSYNVAFNNGWIGAAFCIMWFILANFIVLNMFIAVIQENFDVSEDEKRLQQVKAFLAKRQINATSGSQGTLSLSTIFKFGQVRRQDPLDYGSAQTEMLLKDAVVRDFLDDHEIDSDTSPPSTSDGMPTNNQPVKSGTLSQRWEQLLNRLFNREPNPFYSNVELQKAHEEVDTRQMVKEVVAANERVKRAQREYLRKYPNYNVSMFIFRINNPIRKVCQRIVGPGRGGDRIEGVAPSRPIWYGFSAFIYAAIVAMVLLACVTTPLYQKEYFRTHDFEARNWFVYSDMGFATLFTVESIIRVIADGFYWTPNAYYRSSWGIIDGIVLVTLWTDIFTTIYNPGGGSRAVGAFKALRALRLLNVSDNARDTFHSVIVMGGWKVISAAFVSMSLLIPFAIYGLNIFNGRFMECNDGNGISLLTDCTGEYLSSPFEWDVLAPRQVANPYYDFDNFGSSLFILFQIVSQEGWIDVMWTGQSITGVFTQPDAFASQWNALFFVAFNLLGAVFVLTLFVSVFMRNYTEQTGVAFLTTEQRSWLELRKLLRQISPSKRPSSKEVRETWKEWCYRRAVTKNGRWQRSVTAVLVLHLLLLCLEWYPDNDRWDRARDYIFLVLTLFYIVNIIIRIIGLSWTRFRRSAWDVYSIFAVSGTFVTLILLLTNFKNRDYVQVHKLFLVSIALLLIPRNNQLDQLFKTAAASLTSIANLLATWFVLFLVFAIAFTQTFGLTRFADGETDNQNFRTVPKALVMLFRMSSGEGWNEVMADFTSVVPPYCTIGEHYYDGDCGSDGWAMALFISWNILSMYVFMNLFISLIYESFSYVYQRSSGLSVISREEIRRFKQAWAEFDPSGSGYISKEKFPRLLGELSGVFEMRIYDGDFTVSNIIADCTSRPQRAHPLGLDGPKDSPQVDLDKLNERLSEIPVTEIQRRRRRMNIFYEEVLVSADPDRGVEFNSLLMILAHYKVINDNKSLRLEEFLRRRARIQRVEEAVRRNVVVGFFDTLYWARRFRKALEAKKSARMTMVPQLDVPEIFIQDDSEDTPSAPSTPIDHQTPSWTTGSDNGTPLFTTGPSASRPNLRNRSDSIQVSPSASPTRPRAISQSSPSELRDIPEDWHFAEALIEGHNRSRSPSPSPQHLDPDATSDAYGGLGVGAGPRSRAQTLSATSPDSRPRAGTLSVAGASSTGARSRATSSVNAQNVLDVLDTSAWGESIRRSFTTRGSTFEPRGSASRDASAEPMPPLPDTRPSSSSNAEGNDHEHPHEL
ncbi:hypothetical protein AUEXF2481DRAFT_45612 [Aureobasidium subglaciale EXF-2481]|uniref:Calcium-channel protein CCH1 n=1 Tax=Aureobasidium subglaciale (strain EXF-2481) TaxID=1043005 RepID=A0A074YXK1_AURSE|nr:uncharacterized protein AUEXF2481DRAFT_45612 [Aureobasidium subglaciale EXF-2481]KER00875.1 hypothetical protein AUEXF2481DRAFT_45612 [Aureobasidium subglaciale EXF-2481]